MEDNKIVKKLKTASSIAVIGAIMAVTMLLCNLLNISYALRSFNVVFNRAEGTEVMKRCTTNAEGKLTEECLTEIAKVCAKWSLQKCNHSHCEGDTQSDPKTVSELGEIVFSGDTNYYCKGGSSQSGYDKGCYVCKADSSIVKWGFSTDADSKCTGGYQKDSSKDEEQCYVNACYVCKVDETIMEWRSNDISDDNCPGGYNKTNTPESECRYVEPEKACYVCKTDEKLYKWDISGDNDDKCSAGYNKVDKTESECKYVEPEKACYVCKTDEKIYKWDISEDSDSKCEAGYNKVEKIETECKYVEPKSPDTGRSENLIILMIACTLVALSVINIYSIKNGIN